MSATSELNGKYVLITGGTSGIGLAAAKEFAARGARMGLIARTPAKAEAVADEIRSVAGHPVQIDIFQADLTSQQSIRRAAVTIIEQAPRIDVLVNNAGAMYGRHEVSEDGIELTWALNVLAPYLLTTLLLEHLTPGARIITTSSHGHKVARDGIDFDRIDGANRYTRMAKLTGGPGRRYGESKLAVIMLTSELGRRMNDTAVSAYCFDPGLVATNFNSNSGWMIRAQMSLLRPFSRTPAEGAETLVWLAESPDVPHNGGYYTRNHLENPAPAAQDPASTERLWRLCADQIH